MAFGFKKRHSVFGIFNEQASIDHCIEMLKSQNFKNSDISVLMQSSENNHTLPIEINSALTALGLGFPEFEAKRFEGLIKKGGKLISIYVDNSAWEAKAREILSENGAEYISTTSEKKFHEPNYFHHSADLEFIDKQS